MLYDSLFGFFGAGRRHMLAKFQVVIVRVGEVSSGILAVVP
jgi:hypothetical protein